ncbi:hypothetical protein JD844_000674 [Phrynosoma platyrhinos]|uniref:Cirhin n=1 Tax=Phrynosoma platyrhinos TaxID=52577 RepID=A0ABQ7SR11_PHRPL|nr:hypothetical protein JD844_000674 [Phrynosoma platyrhinos]
MFVQVGCDDGSIKLFAVLSDRIQFERQLDRQKGRILSLSWHPSGTKIAAGSLDLIRVFDIKSGRAIQQIHVDRRLQESHTQKCVVWGVAFLSDGTIVSADSAGKVQFWDSEMGTLLSKHPVSKSAVLCVAASEGPDHIGSSCVSPCGTWIAYSTTSKFYLHRVQFSGDQISIKRVPDTPKQLRSAHCLLFSADSTRLFVASNRGCVHVLKLLKSGTCKFLHTLRPNSETTEAVYLLSASSDGRWLAAASGNREINIYSLEDAKLFEFSIADQEYTPWSRKVQQVGLHRDWLERDTPITHIAFNPRQASHILLHDTYMFCIVDKSLPLPKDTAILNNQVLLSQLSRAAQRTASHAFKICKKYQPLLFVDLLDEVSLVVVERSISDLKAQLPPPVYQKKFGT